MKGGLLINKPIGITSHDAIYQLRKLPQLKDVKVGHSGTLDPFAEGVLIVLLGVSTRLQDELHLLQKTYETEITLGANTDTDDVTGAFLPLSKWNLPSGQAGLEGVGVSLIPSKPKILSALAQIKARTTQIPPDYSAIKINNKKMYDLAREGKSIVKKPRPIIIHEIILKHYSYPTLTISVTCSTGTYIRSIARDIGAILGTGGHCSQLKRTAIGNFNIKNSITVEQLPENINSVLIPPEQLTSHLQSIIVGDLNVAKLKNGREVESDKNIPINTPIALLDANKKLFGIGYRKTEALILESSKIFL